MTTLNPRAVEALAQEIRRVDGSNSLGAGALAEALLPFVAALSQPAIAVKGLREQVEKLCCRGYCNGVELVSRNTVLAIIDDAAALLADGNAWYSAEQMDEIERSDGNV